MSNVTLGFSLFDSREGPTEEDERVMANMDNLSLYLKRLMFSCERIRGTLKLGAPRMDAQQIEMAAGMLDLMVAKTAAPSVDGALPRRYCYPKVVLPSPTIPDMFHTYFWTPNGEPLQWKDIHDFQNFKMIPFVELEDIFVNKAVRSLQLKLRECIVFPPERRPTCRFSVCFPQRECSYASIQNANSLLPPSSDVATAEPPAPTEPLAPMEDTIAEVALPEVNDLGMVVEVSDPIALDVSVEKPKKTRSSPEETLSKRTRREHNAQ